MRREPIETLTWDKLKFFLQGLLEQPAPGETPEQATHRQARNQRLLDAAQIDADGSIHFYAVEKRRRRRR